MERKERKRLVVGNWKMQLSHKAELETIGAIKNLLKNVALDVEVVVCPSFPSLAGVAEVVKKSTKLAVGAQNIHWEEKGAWTGSVSVLQIKPFAQWCIVGHSEQRALTGESDEEVQVKVSTLLKYGLTPVVCVGETAQERASEQTTARVSEQTKTILNKMTRVSLSKLVITYEPIWAISANQPDELPDPNNIAGTMLLIRKLAADRFGVEAAERLRILYGGSVTPDNVASFVFEPGVDGVLVGGASVHPGQFVNIIKQLQGGGSQA